MSLVKNLKKFQRKKISTDNCHQVAHKAFTEWCWMLSLFMSCMIFFVKKLCQCFFFFSMLTSLDYIDGWNGVKSDFSYIFQGILKKNLHYYSMASAVNALFNTIKQMYRTFWIDLSIVSSLFIYQTIFRLHSLGAVFWKVFIIHYCFKCCLMVVLFF